MISVGASAAALRTRRYSDNGNPATFAQRLLIAGGFAVAISVALAHLRVRRFARRHPAGRVPGGSGAQPAHRDLPPEGNAENLIVSPINPEGANLQPGSLTGAEAGEVGRLPEVKRNSLQRPEHRTVHRSGGEQRGAQRVAERPVRQLELSATATPRGGSPASARRSGPRRTRRCGAALPSGGSVASGLRRIGHQCVDRLGQTGF